MRRSCCTSNQFVLLHTAHTCLLLSNFQQISCSDPTGQHSHIQASRCPVWALQLLLYIYIHTVHESREEGKAIQNVLERNTGAALELAFSYLHT